MKTAAPKGKPPGSTSTNAKSTPGPTGLRTAEASATGSKSTNDKSAARTSDEGRSGAPSHRTTKQGLTVESRRTRRRSGPPTTKAGKTSTAVPDAGAPGAAPVDGEGAPPCCVSGP
ncbi:hypothetical protein MTO96_019011 [Rhipicephalus appendiculatus]